MVKKTIEYKGFTDYLQILFSYDMQNRDWQTQALTMLFTLPIFILYAFFHVLMIGIYLVVGLVASIIGLICCVLCPLAMAYDWIKLKLRKNE